MPYELEVFDCILKSCMPRACTEHCQTKNKGLYTHFLLRIPFNSLQVGIFTGKFSLSIVIFFAGLWKVCEKYRKLMNELAQVSNLTLKGFT